MACRLPWFPAPSMSAPQLINYPIVSLSAVALAATVIVAPRRVWSLRLVGGRRRHRAAPRTQS